MFRPDITETVDWALKKQLPSYLYLYLPHLSSPHAIRNNPVRGRRTHPRFSSDRLIAAIVLFKGTTSSPHPMLNGMELDTRNNWRLEKQIGATLWASDDDSPCGKVLQIGASLWASDDDSPCGKVLQIGASLWASDEDSPCGKVLPLADRPDMIFAVDWALKTNYLLLISLNVGLTEVVPTVGGGERGERELIPNRYTLSPSQWFPH